MFILEHFWRDASHLSCSLPVQSPPRFGEDSEFTMGWLLGVTFSDQQCWFLSVGVRLTKSLPVISMFGEGLSPTGLKLDPNGWRK